MDVEVDVGVDAGVDVVEDVGVGVDVVVHPYIIIIRLQCQRIPE
jgi:hypothetical protein